MRRIKVFIKDGTGVPNSLGRISPGTTSNYGYSLFCERLRRLGKNRVAFLRIQYNSADTLLDGFAGDTLYYIDSCTMEAIHSQVLVCVLAFNGYR